MLLTFLVFCVVLCFVCLHVLSCVFNVTSVSGLSILYCLWFSLTFIRMRRKKLEIVVDKLKVLYIPHLVNPRQLFFKNTRSTWYWWRLNNTNIWPLCCLFFFDLRILITPLVSSNSSCLICKPLFSSRGNAEWNIPIFHSKRPFLNLAYNYCYLCICVLILYIENLSETSCKCIMTWFN